MIVKVIDIQPYRRRGFLQEEDSLRKEAAMRRKSVTGTCRFLSVILLSVFCFQTLFHSDVLIARAENHPKEALTKQTFDSVRYANDYADLKMVFGYNHDALWNHYQIYGREEGRVVHAVAKDAASGLRRAYIDGVVPVSQYPELPTGCEVTALTIALNYAGYAVDKCTLSDNFLPKSGMGVYSPTNPHHMFIGEPRFGGSYGCYSEPIVACALNYGANAQNISGTAFENLFSYIGNNRPVLIWGTMGMHPTSYNTAYQYVDAAGRAGWKNGEHCLVMVGYDLDRNVVAVADPLKGAIVEYNLDVVRARYMEQECQAVIVY